MIDPANILAAGKGLDGAELIILVAVLVIGGLASLFQKQQKKRAEEEARRKAELQRTDEARRPTSQPVPQPAPQRPALRPPPADVQPAEALYASEPTPVPVPARGGRVSRAKARPPRRTCPDDGEVHRHVPDADQPAPIVTGPQSIVSLGPSSDARRAMIYHEIFSPPKALRTDAEPWDA